MLREGCLVGEGALVAHHTPVKQPHPCAVPKKIPQFPGENSDGSVLWFASGPYEEGAGTAHSSPGKTFQKQMFAGRSVFGILE